MKSLEDCSKRERSIREFLAVMKDLQPSTVPQWMVDGTSKALNTIVLETEYPDREEHIIDELAK